MLEVHIRVKREHIDTGLAASCFKCPVALALMETFPEVEVRVFKDCTSLGTVSYYLPEHIERWIDDFDAGIPQIPTSFKLQFQGDELNLIHVK